MRHASDAPVRPARILPADVVFDWRADGTVYARSPHPLGPYPATIVERLTQWAGVAPDRVFLAERDRDGGWRRLSYGDARRHARAVAQALLDRRLTADRPIVILSGNAIDHAIIALAAMTIGQPYAPIAPSYSLVAREYTTLGALWAMLDPAFVYVADSAAFAPALRSVLGPQTEVVTSSSAPAAIQTTPFADLLATQATTAVDDASQQVGPETIAKVLFTSGSTGAPKGVINTQRMLCANQEMIRAVMPFLGDEPPVLCDWLPWNHTFGGNHNFGITLYNGGTLYLDDGRPAPGLFDTTLANLREIATTAYYNVPRGYEMLVPALRSDRAFRTHFFSRLQMLFYAAAGLRQDVADEIDALAIDACGERVVWVTGLGATETAPFALCTGAQMTTTAKVGVPVPGVELKLAPVGGRLEGRVRGPNVTPGYWRDQALTDAAFDDEGYYKFGDALAFVDRDAPDQGLVIEGRLAEDFKLSTGTWVRVGPLRARLLAHFGNLVQDVVIAGHGHERVAVLFFPNAMTCRRLAGATAAAALRDVLATAAVQERFRERLRTFAAANPGSSTAVTRAALVDEPPSLDAQELTDKGSINQKAALGHRAAAVAQLYGAAGPAIVVDISDGGSLQ